MNNRQTVRGVRLRYAAGLSVIALLVTASFFTMQTVVSEQRDFSSIVNLAGHQAGLANRIAYFSSLMAATDDETEFRMARAQVGRTINKMERAHEILRKGDPQNAIPVAVNDNLITIYEDPMVGLDRALANFLERAKVIYESEMEGFDTGSAAYIYLTTYGPHVLEPMLDAAVDEYQEIGRQAILRIERLEILIWLATLCTLLLEIVFIFLPLERRVRNTFESLQSSITALQSTRGRLLAAQKLAAVGDWEFSRDSGTMTWSDQIYAICGVSPVDFTVTLESAMELIHPEDRGAIRTTLQRCSTHLEPVETEYRVMRPDGTVRLVYQQAEGRAAENGEIVRIVGIIQDITERKELSTRLEKLSEHIPGFLFEYNLDPVNASCFPYVSRGIEEACGLSRQDLRDDPESLFRLVHREDLPRLRENFAKSAHLLTTWQDKFRFRHKEREEIWLEGHASPDRLTDGSTRWYGYIWDITESKRSEDRIRELALYDPLTGLANRRLLRDRILHAISTSRRNGNHGAVIMLDLDNFKTLNDTRGHNAGDALLVEVASRLQACVRETDTIARLGGDEFVVVLEWLGIEKEPAHHKAMEVAEKIRRALNRGYPLGEDRQPHHASASIGVALFLDNHLSEEELLKRADVAMYEAKDCGRNRVCLYSEERQAAVNRRTAMASAMQRALQDKEFSLYLQPQMAANGRLCGAEALLRWFPPGKEAVSPETFISVAEETGFIQPLGEWVIAEACSVMVALERCDVPKHFTLAVNISARQFEDDQFVDKVGAIIAQSGVKVHRLKFELTESCLVQDLARGQRILTALCDMGLLIELDDFGTGYSSLNVLNSLPLTTLKIDGSLIRGINGDPSGKAIVRAAVAMAKAMSLQTVAEGVETTMQREFLVNEGCDMLQGFYFARPMSFTDFLGYIRLQEQTPAAAQRGHEDLPAAAGCKN